MVTTVPTPAPARRGDAPGAGPSSISRWQWVSTSRMAVTDARVREPGRTGLRPLDAREERRRRRRPPPAPARPRWRFSSSRSAVAVRLPEPAQDLDGRARHDRVQAERHQAQARRQVVQDRVEAGRLRLVLGELPRRLLLDVAG